MTFLSVFLRFLLFPIAKFVGILVSSFQHEKTLDSCNDDDRPHKHGIC